jgi:hypothetical protein
LRLGISGYSPREHSLRLFADRQRNWNHACHVSRAVLIDIARVRLWHWHLLAKGKPRESAE